MSGKVVHFEIPADDEDRARTFYASAFGWTMTPMPEMSYTMVETGPSDPRTGPEEPGFINGGMMRREGDFTAPNLVIDVDDIETALRVVTAAGGSTVSERQPVGEMGFAAYCRDTEGNLVGLWETASGG
jgi:predicted enzyme related to lactoylglutathione lyase